MVGLALETVFALRCLGWSDPEQLEPLSFAFAYRRNGDPTGRRKRRPSVTRSITDERVCCRVFCERCVGNEQRDGGASRGQPHPAGRRQRRPWGGHARADQHRRQRCVRACSASPRLPSFSSCMFLVGVWLCCCRACDQRAGRVLRGAALRGLPSSLLPVWLPCCWTEARVELCTGAAGAVARLAEHAGHASGSRSRPLLSIQTNGFLCC